MTKYFNNQDAIQLDESDWILDCRSCAVVVGYIPIPIYWMFLIFALGLLMYTTLFTKDLKSELNAINNMASVENNRRKIYKNFSNFIRIHANVKQLSE